MQRVTNDGINVQSGAGDIRQLIAVTMAQHSMKDTDTKADSFRHIARETSCNMRQRAKAPATSPKPKVRAKAAEVVSAARA